MEMSAMVAMLEDSISSMIDVVATEGLTALKRVLDESGFAESPNLKDYQLTARVTDDMVEFEISIDMEGLDDASKKKVRKENEDVYRNHAKQVRGKGEAKEFVRTYMMSPKGRPQRILGRRDARRPAKNARKPALDSRVMPAMRAHAATPKTSGERDVEHEFAAESPRGLDVDRDGKLRIALQREIRNTKRKVIFPKDAYQGIVKKFVDELKDIVESKFAPELEDILARHFS
jgi:hypothetical protein